MANPLDQERKKQLKQILLKYRDGINGIVAEHRAKVLEVVSRVDREQADDLHKRIQNA